jgi:hypothetical protein
MTVAIGGTADIPGRTERWAERYAFPLCSQTFRFLGSSDRGYRPAGTGSFDPIPPSAARTRCDATSVCPWGSSLISWLLRADGIIE